jgi:hypothetical protein
VNQIKYKPSSNAPTAYSLLVSKIKGSSAANEPPPPPPAVPQQDTDSFYYYHTHQHSPSPTFGHQTSPYGSVEFQMGSTSPQVPLTRPKSQVPSEQDQQVIEKMASYVVKNGPAFEELARTKGDVRFVFLNPTHEFHWYYLNCKERYKAETSSVVAQGSFIKYSDSKNQSSVSNASSSSSSAGTNESDPVDSVNVVSRKRVIPLITSLPSVSLPLSASGIPIANHESFSSRPTTIPPAVASRIEEIRRKKDLLKKEQEIALAQQEVSLKKETKAKIQFSSAIGKSMPLGQTDSSSVPGDEDNDSNAQKTIGVTSASHNENHDLQNDAILDETSKSSLTAEENKESFEKTDSYNVLKSNASAEVDESEEKLKSERRKKAALFLMKIRGRDVLSTVSETLNGRDTDTLTLTNPQGSPGLICISYRLIVT